MYKVIPGNHRYKVSLNGDFIDDCGRRCTLPIVDGFLNIEFNGELKKTALSWLVLYAHYETFLPKEHAHKTENVIFLETDSSKTRGVDNNKMFFKQPMYLKPGFRIVPNFTTVAVSNNGIVISCETGLESHITRRHGDYDSTYVYDP